MAGRGLAAAALALLAAASVRPSPAHLIVGRPITLPSALFAAEPAGSPTLVTFTEAGDVERAFWPLWQQALVDADTRALTQLAPAGAMLSGVINQCAGPRGRCTLDTSPPPLNYLRIAVPEQSAYPLYFLAEVQTIRYVDAANGLPVQEPWLELQVLTKASPQAPWQLSFDTGAGGSNGSAAPFVALDATQDGYNPVPQKSTVVPADRLLPLLAVYWQSFRETGRPPASTPFVSDGYTTGVGEQIARHRQNSIYAGNRERFHFAPNPAAGVWQFGVHGGYPMMCGTLRDVETIVPLKSLLYQNPDETNYGVSLRPGLYRSITNIGDHETCVVSQAASLDAIGNNDYSSAITGHFVKPGPVPKNRALADVETAYWVLANQVHQYQTQLVACDKSHALASCIKLYASRAALQVAVFQRLIDAYALPQRVAAAKARLIAAAHMLNARFERNAPAGQIATAIAQLNARYRSLVRALA
jgi:hypothetical protein